MVGRGITSWGKWVLLFYFLQLPVTKANDSLGLSQPVQIDAVNATMYADFWDDLIVLLKQSNGTWKNPTPAIFDDYFSTLKGIGISRLVVWESGLPMLLNLEDEYCGAGKTSETGLGSCDDWKLHKQRINALVSARYELLGTWQNVIELRRTQLANMGLISMVRAAAARAGVSLSFSYRPVDPAISLYYQIPVVSRSFIVREPFLPFASPEVNYYPEQLGQAHYRRLMMQGRESNDPVRKRATLSTIQIPSYPNGPLPKLRIVGSRNPPYAPSSKVLQEQTDKSYRLVPYSSVKDYVEARPYNRYVAKGFTTRFASGKGLLIEGVSIPEDYPYIWIENAGGAGDPVPVFPAQNPVRFWSQAGTELGRLHQYYSLDKSVDPSEQTWVANVTASGGLLPERQVGQNSLDIANAQLAGKVPLNKGTLVINRGEFFTSEILDFRRPTARAHAIRFMKRALQEGYDEVLINSRTHAALPGYINTAYTNYWFFSDAAFTTLVQNDTQVTKLTTFDGGFGYYAPGSVYLPNEIMPGSHCQKSTCQFQFRYNRNVQMAVGLEALAKDTAVLSASVQAKTPRMLITPREETTLSFASQGVSYTSINHDPKVAEGFSLVRLNNTNVEPVYLGVRDLPSETHANMIIQGLVDDLADRRSSNYLGPMTFFNESHVPLVNNKNNQSTYTNLTAKRRAIICETLKNSSAVHEVLVYESAEWYRLAKDSRSWVRDGAKHDFICP